MDNTGFPLVILLREGVSKHVVVITQNLSDHGEACLVFQWWNVGIAYISFSLVGCISSRSLQIHYI